MPLGIGGFLLFSKQNFFIGSVENIVLATHHFKELLKKLPSLGENVELISVPPDVENLRFVGFHGKELFAKLKHLIPLTVVIDGALKTEKVFLNIKASVCFKCAGVFNSCVFAYQLCASVVVVFAAAGISHTNDLISHKLGKTYSVNLDLTYDFFIIINVGKPWVLYSMRGNLVSGVYVLYVFWLYFVMRYRHSFSDK